MRRRRHRHSLLTVVMLAVAMLAAAVSMAGCDSPPTAPPGARVPAEAVELTADPVPGDALSRFRFSSGLTERQRLVVRSAEQWAEVWGRITRDHVPAPPAPAIDFSREIVVLVAMGQRATGGYSIAIRGVHEAAGRLYVDVLERSPGRNCLTTQALTAPLDAVRVPRRDGAVLFVERAETVDCS